MFYETMYTEIKFVMTSVHDVSLKDAWSRVIQSVLEPLPNLETLLINFSVVSFDQLVMISQSADGRHRQWRIRSCLTCNQALSSHPTIVIAMTTR